MPRQKTKKVPKNVRRYVSKKIAKMSETKSRLLSYDAQSVTNFLSPISTALTAVEQGDTQNKRDGNQIMVTGFYSKWVLAGADNTNIIRMILYWPKDPNGDLANDSVDIHTLIDQDKYNVIYDRYHTVGSQGPSIKTWTVARNFHKGARNGIRCVFRGTGQTDYGSSPLRMLIFSDSDAASHPTLSGNLRLYYKDF